MSGVRVKICGITSLKDLFIAVEAGADAVGFIVDVPRSPRNLSINEAKKLMKSTPVFIETVAVTVPKDLNHLETIYRKLDPDIVQVHGLGDLSNEIRERLPNARLIGAVHVESDLAIDTALQTADIFDAILLDSYVLGKYGGTGKTHNWELSKHVRDAIYPKPLILAGGLKPKNVKEAIFMVKPYAVDVSSGVESNPGIKDRKKVSEFIKNVREVEV